MVQGLCLEADSPSASQEVPRLLWYLNRCAHYRVHKWSQLDTMLNQSTDTHHVSLSFILILSSYLRLGRPYRIPFSAFPSKMLHKFINPFRASCSLTCYLPLIQSP